MANALSSVSTRRTPQSEQADPRQVENLAGGYVFQVSDETKIHRFLTIGVEGGTYYASEQALTKDNAQTVIACAQSDKALWLVEQIRAVSLAGRAPRQNSAIFALAVVAALGSDEARSAAFAAVPAVCRTGTHLFLFTGYSLNFRGWRRGLRSAVGGWFLNNDVDSVAYQACKYRQREGWSQRDLLRLSHPETSEPARKALFDWICGREVDLAIAPDLVGAFKAAQETTLVSEWVQLISDHPISWEMLPDIALKEPEVWKALIRKGMPQTALQRQLPRLTNLDLFADREILNLVVAQLQDPAKLRKGRVHPISIMTAMKTYSNGRSVRGSNTWTPNRRIVDALDGAFYASYATTEPAGKRTLLALDVSGSMGSPAGGTVLSCREVTVGMALVSMNIEPECDVIGFTGGGRGWGSRYGGPDVGNEPVSELRLSPRQRLDDAVRYVDSLPFGSTDCALPCIWAGQKGRLYDTIVIMTDNETWAGAQHPHQALREYRNKTGINTRLAVIGLTSTGHSIADPNDPGQIDIAGFDSAVPNLITDFSRGDV